MRSLGRVIQIAKRYEAGARPEAWCRQTPEVFGAVLIADNCPDVETPDGRHGSSPPAVALRVAKECVNPVHPEQTFPDMTGTASSTTRLNTY